MVDSQAPREPHSVASGPRRWASTPKGVKQGRLGGGAGRLPRRGDAPSPAAESGKQGLPLALASLFPQGVHRALEDSSQPHWPAPFIRGM